MGTSRSLTVTCDVAIEQMQATSNQLKVGLIGVGGMGARHAHNLHYRIGDGIVAGVCDPQASRAAHVAAECGSAPVFNDPYQLIEDEQIQAVLIASPDETRAEFVLACLGQEKPVLCEKPLATNAADAWIVIEAEERIGRKLVAVGFMRRFDAPHLGVKKAVSSGVIGRPLLFKGVHRNAGIPADFPAEAVVSQAAIHDIDSTRWLLEQEITEVHARGVRVDESLGRDVFDLVTLNFSLTANCLASIEVFLSARYGYEVSAEVVGERGTVVTRQPDRALLRADQIRSLPVPMDWLSRFQDAYVDELRHWATALRGGSFQGADAWDGYISLIVSDACIRSLRTGQPEQVRAPVKPALYSAA